MSYNPNKQRSVVLDRELSGQIAVLAKERKRSLTQELNLLMESELRAESIRKDVPGID